MIIKNPQYFSKFIVNRLIDKSSMYYDDLIQICLITIWEKSTSSENYPVRYFYKCCIGRCKDFLKKMKRCKSGFYKRIINQSPPLDSIEYKDLIEVAIRYLSPKDAFVFRLWVEGSTCLEIAELCSWIKSDPEKALIRIFTTLREKFGGETTASIIVSRNRRKMGPGINHNTREYQRRYYQEHRKERINNATKNRRSRIKISGAMEELHEALKSRSFSRYGLADSGDSAYYVNANGLRIRVSNHPPVNITEGMIYMYTDQPFKTNMEKLS